MTARPALPLPPVTTTLFMASPSGRDLSSLTIAPFANRLTGAGVRRHPEREGGQASLVEGPSTIRAGPEHCLTGLSVARDQGRFPLLCADPLGFRGDGRHAAPQTSATVLSAYRSSRFRASAMPDVNVLMQAMPFGSVRERYAGQVRADLDQAILSVLAPGERVRPAQLLMVEVLARRQRQRVVADGEPSLRHMGLAHVIRRIRASHARWHPAGFQGIGADLRPAPRNREGEKHIVQLALRIGLRPLPGSLTPQNIVEVGLRAVVHA